jgi:hypothetical protein
MSHIIIVSCLHFFRFHRFIVPVRLEPNVLFLMPIGLEPTVLHLVSMGLEPMVFILSVCGTWTQCFVSNAGGIWTRGLTLALPMGLEPMVLRSVISFMLSHTYASVNNTIFHVIFKHIMKTLTQHKIHKLYLILVSINILETHETSSNHIST